MALLYTSLDTLGVLCWVCFAQQLADHIENRIACNELLRDPRCGAGEMMPKNVV